MADVYSDIMTDRLATPAVRQDAYNFGGVLRETIATVTPAADEAITSDLVLCPVPSNARVTSIKFRHAEAATTGQGNVGVMRLVDGSFTYTGGDANLFASAYDFDDAGAATSVYVEVIDGAELTGLEDAMPLWEALGLSEDPGEDFYVAIDVSEIFAGGPTLVTAKVQYIY